MKSFSVRLGMMCLLVLGLYGCATPDVQPENFTISNLRVGMVCDPDGEGSVCKPTNDIVVDNRGTCIYNHQQVDCTWFGFSFDYATIAQDVTLDCGVTRDVPADVGNPNGIVAQNSKSQNYTLVLPRGSSHFINPQYTTYPSSGPTVTTEKEWCSYRGHVLFEFTLRFHAPTAGA